MRFTIVTPVFNGMPWLPDAVASVAAQRRDVDVEHLILDGGSTDGSREWLLAHDGLGFGVVFAPDNGQTDALVKGFERASGDVLGWLNSDDLLEPGALAWVRDAFQEVPRAAIVAGGCLLIDPQSRVIGSIPVPPVSTFAELLRFPTNLPQPATFFRADAYRRVGGLDRRYDLAMDVDLWLRLAQHGGIVVLPEQTLARFRIHPAAKSVAGAVAAVREDFVARRRQGMPLWSAAGRHLLIHGYLRPLLRRAAGRLAIRRPPELRGSK
jgi:GT2 family glycosyltransferase